VISTCQLSLNPLFYSKTLDFFIASLPQALESISQVLLALFPNFTQNVMLLHCSKTRSLIFAARRRNTRFLSAKTSTQLALMRWNLNWCKLKHARTCIYGYQVAWLPLSRAVKSFRKLHSHTMYSFSPHLFVLVDYCSDIKLFFVRKCILVKQLENFVTWQIMMTPSCRCVRMTE
jgi:hypothetical protein